MLGKSCISGTAWWIEMKLLGVLWSQVDRKVWFGEGVLVKQKKYPGVYPGYQNGVSVTSQERSGKC